MEDKITNTLRDFKGVWIPKDIWLDNKIGAIEKVILTEIDSLDRDERGCYASNKHIADFCKCSEATVSRAISKLINLGYIRVKSFDGRQRILKSCLCNLTRQPTQNDEAAYANCRHSNIDSNIDSNKRKKVSKKDTSFNEIFEQYYSDSETQELLGEWLKVRKVKRAALTDSAIEYNLKRLDGLADESGMTVNEYLEEVIRRGWASFYVINNYKSEKKEEKEPVRYGGLYL